MRCILAAVLVASVLGATPEEELVSHPHEHPATFTADPTPSAMALYSNSLEHSRALRGLRPLGCTCTSWANILCAAVVLLRALITPTPYV